jgi:GNAT superfamily N-acetyltransferase
VPPHQTGCVDRLVDNPRAFAAAVAGVLHGIAVERPNLSGFASSDFDPFLNHVFASEGVAPRQAAESLAGRPGFVWMAEVPALDEAGVLLMHGMTAATAPAATALPEGAEIVEVRSSAELDDWHEVYCEVFGTDRRGRDDWGQVHDGLGASLLLLLARVDGTAAATGGVFFEEDLAGLYCFTTRERMRGRGLASALVDASHAAARARGIEHALLQATHAGAPVYAKLGYQEERSLPVLRVPAAR